MFRFYIVCTLFLLIIKMICNYFTSYRYILTFGNKTPDGKYKFHMTRKFPWLSNKLIRKGVLQVRIFKIKNMTVLL